MSSSFVAGGLGRKTTFGVAAVLIAALAISLVHVAESSAFEAREAHAVAAKKKKCKKGKKSATAAKKKCKKKKKPVVLPPSPLPLTDAEVISRIGERAGFYCAQDPDCTTVFGYYFDGDPGRAACSSRSTFSWSCFGFWDGDDGTDTYTCDFREVVERDGINGIKSHLDLTFGGGDGFDCFLTSP